VTPLTPKQVRMVEALAGGASITEAADVVGVARQTVHRWITLPAVVEAIAEVQAESRARAVRRLSAALDRAAARVVDLADSAEDESVRLRAAMAVPAMLRELLELERESATVQGEGVRVEYVNDWRATPFVFDHAEAVAALSAAAGVVDAEDRQGDA
jgi:hypothetical protein